MLGEKKLHEKSTDAVASCCVCVLHTWEAQYKKHKGSRGESLRWGLVINEVG